MEGAPAETWCRAIERQRPPRHGGQSSRRHGSDAGESRRPPPRRSPASPGAAAPAPTSDATISGRNRRCRRFREPSPRCRPAPALTLRRGLSRRSRSSDLRRTVRLPEWKRPRRCARAYSWPGRDVELGETDAPGRYPPSRRGNTDAVTAANAQPGPCGCRRLDCVGGQLSEQGPGGAPRTAACGRTPSSAPRSRRSVHRGCQVATEFAPHGVQAHVAQGLHRPIPTGPRTCVTPHFLRSCGGVGDLEGARSARTPASSAPCAHSRTFTLGHQVLIERSG